MALMTTVLTEFSDNGNNREYSLSDHTVLKPSKVLQRRKQPTGNQVVAEDHITVTRATEDADGNVLPQNVSMTVTIRRPKFGQSTDIDSVLATFRDIIAGDEFTTTVQSQKWLS